MNKNICAALVIGAGFFTASVSAQSQLSATDANADPQKPAAERTAAAPTKADERLVGRVKMTETPDREKLVCRVEKPTGSHYPQRVCRTAAQMAADRAEAMADIRNTELRRRNDRSSRIGTGQSMQRYKDSRGGR